MTIIDTHLHIIDQSRLSYPWLSGYPQLVGNYLYGSYASEALSLGIEIALLMEVDVPFGAIESEADMADELGRLQGPPIAGAVSSCRPEEPSFPEFLQRQYDRLHVKGLRRVLHVVPDEVSAAPLFRSNLNLMAGGRLPFDLCVFARQLRLTIDLVDACPEVQFVLDHGGQPDIKRQEWEPWASDLAELALRPNVAVKVSGFIAYADAATWRPEVLRAYFERCIRMFGWDRVLWGSDWPICVAAGGLQRWVGATHELLRGCSDFEKQALLELNARRIYRI